MRILRAALIFLSALSPIAAMAQSTVLQGGAWTPGHVPQYSTYGSQPVVIDGGGSGGGALGQNLSELGIVSRSPTNTYPSANSGNGPNGEHGCLYDAPITNATGYHYLCLDPNAQGGGLISYGAGGIASQNGLSFKINGVVYNVGQAGSLLPAGPTVLGGVYAQTSYSALPGLGSAANQTKMTVNVLDYGADPTGVADSSAAFVSAAAASRRVFIPCGTYQINLTLTAWNNSLLEGALCSVLVPHSGASPVISTVSTYNSVFRGFTVSNPGGYTIGTSSGIVWDTNSNNNMIDKVLVQGFNQYGISCAGTSPTETTGNQVLNSWVLYNGVSNINWNWCSDGHIVDNQFGGLGTTPTWGIHVSYGGANQFKGNFVWSNGIDFELDNSFYNWISQNRITQASKQGLLFSSSGNSQVVDNQFYQNSATTIGAYPSSSVVASRDIVWNSNQYYDWSGVAHTNYSFVVDATSSNITATGNEWQDSIPTNTIAPTNISSSATGILLGNNTPTSNAYTNNTQAGSVPIFTPAAGVGGTISTVYLGPISGASEQPTPSPAAGVVQCFTVFSSAAPGAGETWTYTLRYNNANQALTASQTTGQYSASVCSQANAVAVAVGPNGTLDLKLATSGATNLGGVSFRGFIAITQ